MKWKTKNYTLSEQFQNPIENYRDEIDTPTTHTWPVNDFNIFFFLGFLKFKFVQVLIFFLSPISTYTCTSVGSLEICASSTTTYISILLTFINIWNKSKLGIHTSQTCLKNTCIQVTVYKGQFCFLNLINSAYTVLPR
jgi:hypothetical protein